MTPTISAVSKRTNVVLWIVQGLLALLFLFTGGLKLATPMDVLAAQSHLPGPFMKFIATCEVLGALGLVLPGLFRIRPGLTPLAAAGLVIIMIGAVVTTLVQGLVGPAILSAAVGLLAGYVAEARGPVGPPPGAAPRPAVSAGTSGGRTPRPARGAWSPARGN